jgi:hypothetical protein
MAVVEPPSSIDRTGQTDASAALTTFTDTLPAGTTVRMGAGARYRCDLTWWIDERIGLEIDGQGAEVFRSRRDGSGSLISVIGGRDLDLHDLRITGSNVLMEASAHTPREGQHTLYLSGAVDACVYRVELSYSEGDLLYLGRKKIGPSGSDASYTPCDNVWVTAFTAHHAGRQIITCQGVKDCVIADGEATEGCRAWLEMEGLKNAGNGVDGLLVANMIVGPTRLNMIANAGSQRADRVTFERNRLARSLIVYGKHTEGGRRNGWVITGNRLLDADGRFTKAPLPGKPPHAGSPQGCTVNLTRYDDLTVTRNGLLYLDAGRTPPMVLCGLTDCQGFDVSGNEVVEVFGGDSSRQWNVIGPGVQVRADAASVPAMDH